MTQQAAFIFTYDKKIYPASAFASIQVVKVEKPRAEFHNVHGFYTRYPQDGFAELGVFSSSSAAWDEIEALFDNLGKGRSHAMAFGFQ